MSKYTTELRFICETCAGYIEQQGYGNVDEIVEAAAPYIFDFDFPIFDEDYRLGLEKKILRHFYTREISEETIGLWKLRLSDRMNMMMPYFNQLYNSELLEFNPLYDVDIETTSNRETSGETTGNTSGESSETSSTTGEQTTSASGTSYSTDAYSDTPQGALSDVEDMKYLTNARVINGKTTDNETATSEYSGTKNGTSTGSTSGTSASTSDYVEKVAGKRGVASYSSYLKEFRETFLNIDNQVVDSLNDLFFNLW